MFLFPKEFATKSEIDAPNIVLKDKNNNRITIPLRSSLVIDDYDYIIANGDEFEVFDLSKNDLKSIYCQFNNMLNDVSANKLNDNSEDFNFESYIEDRELELQSLKDKVTKDLSETDKAVASLKIPTLDQLKTTNEYVVRLEQELIPILKNYQNVSARALQQKYCTEYSKLPPILCDSNIELDLCNIKKFVIEFRALRMSFDMTQKDVKTSIKLVLGKYYDASTICRFESASLHLGNMKDLIRCARLWIKKIYAAGIDITVNNIRKHSKRKKLSSDDNDSSIVEDSTNIIVEETNKDENTNNISISSDDEWLNKNSRRKRTVYTEEQKTCLEKLFMTVKLTQITAKVYEKYAKELNLDKKSIQSWMSKRRKEERIEQQIKRKKARK